MIESKLWNNGHGITWVMIRQGQWGLGWHSIGNYSPDKDRYFGKTRYHAIVNDVFGDATHEWDCHFRTAKEARNAIVTDYMRRYGIPNE